jgi:hypothetical protein
MHYQDFRDDRGSRQFFTEPRLCNAVSGWQVLHHRDEEMASCPLRAIKYGPGRLTVGLEGEENGKTAKLPNTRAVFMNCS